MEGKAGGGGFTEELALTFDAWYWRQLGEFRLISVGEISERGRGRPLVILAGDEPGVVCLAMRRGCTWGRDAGVSGRQGEAIRVVRFVIPVQRP